MRLVSGQPAGPDAPEHFRRSRWWATTAVLLPSDDGSAEWNLERASSSLCSHPCGQATAPGTIPSTCDVAPCGESYAGNTKRKARNRSFIPVGTAMPIGRM